MVANVKARLGIRRKRLLLVSLLLIVLVLVFAFLSIYTLTLRDEKSSFTGDVYVIVD